jgi:DNA-binding transcriptional LysR family regulator
MTLDLNTRYLRYLLAVVDEGSFSRAAERLSVSQPAVSRRIKLLEEAFQFPILERRPQTVVLTPEGSVIVSAVRDLVDSAAETARLIQQLNAERVRHPRIGVEVHVVQSERSLLIERYKEAFPSFSVEIETAYSRALVQGLSRDRYDIVAISSPIPDERFEYIALRWFPVQLVFARSSPLASLKAVPASALEGMPIAAWERSRQPRMFDQIVAPLAMAGARMIFPSDQGKLGIITYAADHGVAALLTFGEYDARSLEDAGMVVRPLADVRPVAALMLLRLASGNRSRSERLWSFAQRWVAENGVPQTPDELGAPQRRGVS